MNLQAQSTLILRLLLEVDAKIELRHPCPTLGCIQRSIINRCKGVKEFLRLQEEEVSSSSFLSKM